MNTTHTYTEKIETVISSEHKDIVQKAADAQGLSLNEFVVSNLIIAAQNTLDEKPYIELSKEDQDQFIGNILNPPEPTDQMKKNAKKYLEKMYVF